MKIVLAIIILFAISACTANNSNIEKKVDNNIKNKNCDNFFPEYITQVKSIYNSLGIISAYKTHFKEELNINNFISILGDKLQFSKIVKESIDNDLDKTTEISNKCKRKILNEIESNSNEWQKEAYQFLFVMFENPYNNKELEKEMKNPEKIEEVRKTIAASQNAITFLALGGNLNKAGNFFLSSEFLNTKDIDSINDIDEFKPVGLINKKDENKCKEIKYKYFSISDNYYKTYGELLGYTRALTEKTTYNEVFSSIKGVMTLRNKLLKDDLEKKHKDIEKHCKLELKNFHYLHAFSWIIMHSNMANEKLLALNIKEEKQIVSLILKINKNWEKIYNDASLQLGL